MARMLPALLALWSLTAGAEPMPECLLSVPDGGEVRLRQLQAGKVLYLDFWASWCGSCARSFPFMNALAEQLGEKGMVIAVNLDENRSDALGFLARHPARFAVAFDPAAACARAFAVEGMPATYLIDRRGQVRYRHVGFRPDDAAKLRETALGLADEPDATDP